MKSRPASIGVPYVRNQPAPRRRCRARAGTARSARRLQTRWQRVDSGDEHPVALEADTEHRERGERLHEEAGGDDEHQRERDLTDDEQAAQAEAGLASIASFSRFERVVRLDARAAQSRGHSEHHCGDRDRRREPYDPPVDRQCEEDVVDGGRKLPHQQAAAPLREREAEDRTGRREEEAPGEELARESQP
jgi:hypothetical protein